MISPSLAEPPDLLGAGATFPVRGGSEPSLTASLRQAPANACLTASDSAGPVSLSPEVSLPGCAAGSTW